MLPACLLGWQASPVSVESVDAVDTLLQGASSPAFSGGRI